MKLFLQKNAKFLSAGGSAPKPPCLRRLGALPQTSSLWQLGAKPPDPHWPPAAGGSASRPPKQPPPHCEFLATRLYVPRALNRTVPAYRTSISSIFKAYRTNVPYPNHCKKGAPYQRTVLLSKYLGVPYRTYVPYHTAILALNYSQL